MATDDFTANPKKTASRAPGVNASPDYKRNQSITPAAGPVGFDKALEGLSKSYEAYGAIASNIANNASKERAQIDGAEAARKNPTLPVFPSITDADINYNQAYLNESYNVLAAEGVDYLRKVDYEFNTIPNPTGEDLIKLQKSQSDASSIVELGHPSIRGGLQSRFNDISSAQFYKFAEKVSKVDLQKQNQIFQSISKDNYESIYDSALDGNREATGRFAQDQVRAIHGELAAGRINEVNAQELLKDLKLTVGKAELHALIDNEINNGNDRNIGEILSGIANKGMEGFTRTQSDDIVADGYNYNNKRQNVLNVERSDLFSDYKTRLEMGGDLSAAEQLNALIKLTPEQNNTLKLIKFKADQAIFKKEKEFNETTASITDPFKANLLSGSAKNNWYEEMLKRDREQVESQGGQYDRPIIRAARFANMAKGTISDFVETIDKALIHGTPKMARDAANAYTSLMQSNPIALDGLSSEPKKYAIQFQSQIGGIDLNTNAQITPEEVISRIRKDNLGLTPEQKQSLDDSFKTKITDDPKVIKKIKNNLDTTSFRGSDEAVFPLGFEQTVNSMLNAVWNGNKDDAVKIVTNELKARGDIVEQPGGPRFMFSAPTKIYADYNQPNYFTNMQLLSLHQYVEQNEMLRKRMPDTGKPVIELVNDPFAGKTPEEIINMNFFEPLYNSGIIPQGANIDPQSVISPSSKSQGITVSINGKNYLVGYDEDATTKAATEASWTFRYIDDGVRKPFNGVLYSGSDWRWTVNPATLQSSSNLEASKDAPTLQDYQEIITKDKRKQDFQANANSLLANLPSILPPLPSLPEDLNG